MKRIAANRRKLFSLLPGGLAGGPGPFASPAACLEIERIYALPILISGLGSPVDVLGCAIIFLA